MNKTINITLASQIFYVDERTYEVLERYLDAIQQHFASQSYGAEVYADIEARIAEQFTKILQANKLQVITLKDVEKVMKDMGTVSDFGISEKEEEAESMMQPMMKRKLYRNPDDAMLAGVASGIATYFGWEPALVRVAFVLAVIFHGSGILIYFLLWICMPKAKTAFQKMEMRGEPANLRQFEKSMRNQSGRRN